MKKLMAFLSVAVASAAWCADVTAKAPAAAPTVQPVVQPAAQPVAQPAAQPAVQPAAQPAAQPAVQPAAQPAVQPAAQPAVQPAAQPVAPSVAVQPAVEKEPGIMFCLARGLCNISTGWLELPRCMVYDNGFIPVFGLFVGIPEGAFLTITRTLCGVYDIISFGTSGSTFHGKRFPNTIFQSKWQYDRD